MPKRKGSLLRQLTLSLGLAIIFLTLASFYYQYQVQKHILMQSIRGDLRQQAVLLRAWLSSASSRAEREQVARQYVEAARYVDTGEREVIVVDADRRILAANTGQEPGQEFGSPLLDAVMKQGGPREGRCVEAAGQCIVALPCYADAAGENVAAAVLVRQPLTAVRRLVDSLMLGSFALLAATLVIIVVVVHVVLRLKVHKPMQALFMHEYRIREGDLAKIEGEDPANEFSDLYAMYNEMVVRIAEQKKAIIDQKDHVALAHLVRQAIRKLTGPLDDILTKSRGLIEGESSLSEPDRTMLRGILADVTRIARELKSMVVQGDKSAGELKREADRLWGYAPHTDEPEGEHKDKGTGRHVPE